MESDLRCGCGSLAVYLEVVGVEHATALADLAGDGGPAGESCLHWLADSRDNAP